LLLGPIPWKDTTHAKRKHFLQEKLKLPSFYPADAREKSGETSIWNKCPKVDESKSMVGREFASRENFPRKHEANWTFFEFRDQILSTVPMAGVGPNLTVAIKIPIARGR
jgi:hypothetical protein